MNKFRSSRWLWLLPLLYLGLPYLLLQRLNWGLIREGRRAKRQVALTFDDGPDPLTTPAVLDALREHGMRATFFVLLPQAERHPALIARLLAEGHQLAAHGVRHRHGWWRWPWEVVQDIQWAVRDLERLSGVPIRLHRPPHGAYTLAVWLGQRLAGVQGVHWSVEGRDWSAHLTPEQVRERLNARLFPGAVVVLHDAGPGAKNTVPMLPALLRDWRERGYQSVRLDELEGAQALTWRGLLRRLMLVVDRWFDRLGHIEPVSGRADNLFRVTRLPFPQEGVTLQDGTVVLQGTPALEYHVNNPQLVDDGVRMSLRRAPDDFRLLAQEMQHRPEWRDAQVVFCLSSLSPLLRLLGFETHPLPLGAQGWRLRTWSRLLRLAYGNDLEARPTALSILSRRAFLDRYGQREDGRNKK